MAEEERLTREDLEYVFNKATEKFFKTFNAAKVEPTITIQNATISGEADVKKIDESLAKMIQKSASVTASGCYFEDSKPSPENILKATLHISNDGELASLLKKAITDLNILEADMQKLNEFKIKTTLD